MSSSVLLILSKSPSSHPASNQSYYPRTMGFCGVSHSAAEKQSWQHGIYITLWLSRGLTSTNELILPNNSAFIRVASHCVHQTRALKQWLKLLLMREMPSCGHYGVIWGVLCGYRKWDKELGSGCEQSLWLLLGKMNLCLESPFSSSVKLGEQETSQHVDSLWRFGNTWGDFVSRDTCTGILWLRVQEGAALYGGWSSENRVRTLKISWKINIYKLLWL